MQNRGTPLPAKLNVFIHLPASLSFYSSTNIFPRVFRHTLSLEVNNTFFKNPNLSPDDDN